MEMQQEKKILSETSLLCCVTVLLGALLVFCGWVFAHRDFIALFTASPPVPPNTAVGFIMLSLSLVYALHTEKSEVGYTLAGVAAIIGFATFIEYLFKLDLEIDAIAVSFSSSIEGALPRRMAINTTIAMMLMAFSLMRLNMSRTRFANTQICMFALIGGSLGLVSLLGYYFQLESASGWYGYTKMTPMTAAGFCLMSISTVTLIFSYNLEFLKNRVWLGAMSSLVVGVVTSILLWAAVTAEQGRFIQAQIVFHSKAIQNLIQNKITAETELLHSIERLFAGSDKVTYEEFKTFTLPLVAKYPSISGIDWSPLVSHQERNSFEDEMRGAGYPSFSLKQLDSNNRLTSRSESTKYFPVLYTEPEEQNKQALGFDHYSDSIRKAAMDKAIESKTAVSTGLFRLFRLQEHTVHPSDFLIVTPCFTKSEAIRGFVIGAFRLPNLVKDALRETKDLGLDIEFSEGESSSPFFVYRSPQQQDGIVSQSFFDRSNFHYMDQISIADRTWTITFLPTDEYLLSLRTWYPMTVLLSGLAITSLIWFYIFSLRKQNETIQRVVEDLREEKERQAEVVSTQQEIACAGTDIHNVLKVLVEKIQILARAQGCVVEIKDGDEMVYRATSGTVKQYEGFRVKQQGSLAGLCVTTRETLRCDDTSNDPRVDREACQKIGVGSMIVVPLLHENDVLGVLKVVSREPFAFSYRDQLKLQLMAGVISASFSNAAAVEALRRSEAAVAEKNILLERATEFKSQFLANMSHEIRSPLTSIIGYSESLKADQLTEGETQIAIDTILRNGRHLLGVINDILDFSKIEAGKLDIELLPTPLFDVANDIENLMKHKAMEQGIRFSFEYLFPLPKIIQTDPLRVKQILINLIGNAIKFTKKGEVKVTISANRETRQVQFAITDTGIGLTASQRTKLFRAFSQAHTSTTREFGGTGLGLVISNQLAEKLGGTIEVESVPEIGSTFRLVIGSGEDAFETVLETKPEDLQTESPDQFIVPKLKGKVLLAEDGPDNQQYISFVLRKANIHYTIVENGALAVEAATNDRFDLILLDMQMPVMDGYTAAKNLRQSGCEVPIIALTANIMKQNVDQCLDAGCSDFLGKPFERKDFYEKLSQYLKKSGDEGNDQMEVESEENLRCEINDPEYLPLIKEFVSKLQGRVDDIVQAFKKGDFESLSMFAHRLRGSNMFGYPLLGEVTGEIEDGAQQKDIETLASSIQNLESICQRIIRGSDSNFS